MSRDIYIVGGAQTDFARNYSREGHDLFDILRDAVTGSLEDAGVEPAEVEVGHVGNFVGELFGHQGHLGGFFASLHPDLAGVPTSRHEAACASGSVAALAATADLEAGRYDLACVVGVEQMRNVDGKLAAKHLAVAAWDGKEGQEATYLWPAMFSGLAEEYERRYGLDYGHLMKLARMEFDNATGNERAQSRRWTFPQGAFAADDELNPVVEGRMRRLDCGQITDGAAAVLLATEDKAREIAGRTGRKLADIPKILGWGHRTSPMLLDEKLRASDGAEYVFPELRKTLEDAWSRAGIGGVDEIDAVEVHDCFSITAYMIADHFRVAPPGQPHHAIDDGIFTKDGALPLNPSGGLIGVGHPVGATGIRMLHDAERQVSSRAAGTQVADAGRVQTLNIGGSATTTVSFVVGR